MKRFLCISITLLLSGFVSASEFEFETIEKFCKFQLDGDMALYGEPFNETDRLDVDLLSRRIIDELVTSNVAYILYEHGGRGYHQHLVRFSAAKPSDILEVYTSIKFESQNIGELIEKMDSLPVGSVEEL